MIKRALRAIKFILRIYSRHRYGFNRKLDAYDVTTAKNYAYVGRPREEVIAKVSVWKGRQGTAIVLCSFQASVNNYKAVRSWVCNLLVRCAVYALLIF